MSATNSIGVIHTVALQAKDITKGTVQAALTVRLQKDAGAATATVSVTVGEETTLLDNVSIGLLASDAAEFAAALSDASALLAARQEAAAAVTDEQAEE